MQEPAVTVSLTAHQLRPDVWVRECFFCGATNIFGRDGTKCQHFLKEEQLSSEVRYLTFAEHVQHHQQEAVQ